mmetsp:Transcript_11121/g.18172  ORF Transcript_11121/g.18172 Transcript_11121/m.18172 type:complete len:401 (+) Transcript_11121:119-1321(+)
MGLSFAKFCLGNKFNEYVTYEESSGSDLGSIVEYDIDGLLDFLWMFSIPGSIFTRRIALSCFIPVALATGLANWSCITHPNFDRCFPANQDSDGRVGWHNLTMLKFAGFLTVIFTVQVITRWWAVRVLLQGVFGKSNSIVVTLAAALSVSLANQSSEVAKEARLAQEQIFRYLNLAHSLLYKVCDQNKDISDLRRADCAHEEDIKTLLRLPEFHPNDVYSWISILLHRLGQAEVLGDKFSAGKVNLKILITDLEIIRYNSSMVLMYIETQLPLCFLQLLTVVVYAFIFQAIAVGASVIAEGFLLEDYTKIASGYVTLTAMCFVFTSLLEIFRVVHNPLGDFPADFPKNRFQATSAKGYRSIMLVAAELSYRNIRSSLKSSVKPILHFSVNDMLLKEDIPT